MTLIDPARLLFQLQNTGLQNKDNQLYQLLSQMIGALSGLNTSVSGGSSSGTVINNILGFPSILADTDGGSLNDLLPIPGRDGIIGRDGAMGAPGYDGQDGLDGEVIPGPMGPAGPMVPTFIGINEVFLVPQYKQALFEMTIDVEGILEVDGFLIQIIDENTAAIYQNTVQLIEEQYTEDAILSSPVTGSTGATGATGNTGLMGPPGEDGIVDSETIYMLAGIQYDRVMASTSTGTQNDFAIGEGNVIIVWSGAADVTFTGFAAGKPGQRLTIVNYNATYFVHLSPTNVASAAQNRLSNLVTIGTTILAERGSITYEWDSTNSLWRLIEHNQGSWITPTFAAGDYTANGTMTWTVASGDVQFNQYYVIGKNLFYKMQINTTTVGGALNTTLQFTVPNGYNINTGNHNAWGQDNGTFTQTIMQPTSATLIGWRKAPVTNWTASADLTQIISSGFLSLV